MKRLVGLLLLCLGSVGVATGCGGDDDTPPEPSLDDFLPEVPAPDGSAQSVWAGVITSPDELIPGPASSGLVGDYFMRNSRGRFVIQNEQRSIGVVPWGGNVVDAVPLDAQGEDVAGDSFGELSLVYLTGRTCAHESIEIVQDGSGGGAAVLRARGRTNVNDYINLKGMGIIAIPQDIDADNPDEVDCATTYVLRPDSERLEVAWTLFNHGTAQIDGPLGMINDIGGENSIFYPRIGMFHMKTGFEAIVSAGDPTPVTYAVYQSPDLAYGVLPMQRDVTDENGPLNGGAIVAGVSVIIFGVDTFLQILDDEHDFLHLAPDNGLTYWTSLSVGVDGAAVEATFQRMEGRAVTAVSGTVAWTTGDPADARVGVYLDSNEDGALDPEDRVLTYFDAKGGAYAGELPAGTYFLRADVQDVSRSDVVALVVGTTAVEASPLMLPQPARYEYTILDDETDTPVAAKIQVLGASAVLPDPRVHPTLDRIRGVVRTVYAPHGTSAIDPVLELPPGGPYRIFVSHGPEWTVDQIDVPAATSGTQQLEVRLRRVVDTTGYLATEFHQHSMASPDSAVNFEDRLASLVAEGIEFFASTDHDYVFDYAPLIDAADLRGVIDSAVGIEATPFAYGHFQAYPLEPVDDDPTRGAIDWARNADGFALLPSEVWQALRDERGAQIIQINHPRPRQSLADFQSYFNRAGLTFDFENRGFYGDEFAGTVPIEWLRLPPGSSVFSDQFDALEVWNGFSIEDSNGDGVLEMANVDLVLRDWFNFLCFGKSVFPLGNSDTHTFEADVAGLPRTLIRVSDDSAVALEAGLDDEVWERMLGVTPQDGVVTNGPMIRVTEAGDTTSALGATLDPLAGEPVTLEITAMSPDWAPFDTIEVFANVTSDPIEGGVTYLQPLACFTSRDPSTFMVNDGCAASPLGGAQALDVQSESVSGPYGRWVATATITIAAEDIPRRTGATGLDAWLVVRVSSQRAMFPMIVEQTVTSNLSNLDALVTGSPAEVEAALDGHGVLGVAFTTPIFVDFDGGGFVAPFAP